jgi:hypothetical protein
MCHHNVGRDSATHDYNTTFSNEEIPESLEDVLVVLVTSKVVVTNMEVQEFERLEKGING